MLTVGVFAWGQGWGISIKKVPASAGTLATTTVTAIFYTVKKAAMKAAVRKKEICIQKN